MEEKDSLRTVDGDKRIAQDANWKDCADRDKGSGRERGSQDSLMLSVLASK